MLKFKKNIIIKIITKMSNFLKFSELNKIFLSFFDVITKIFSEI